jgi:protoheme IX farnesyltransferase
MEATAPAKRPLKKTLRSYLYLTKPGIVRSNVMTAMAGFILASGIAGFNPWTFIAMVIGLTFVISAACVFNNYIDRDIDAQMKRTQYRALVKGTIAPRTALDFGTVLLTAGLLILFYGTNLLTVLLALAIVFFYIAVYTIAKRRTVYGTLLGTICGAIPPVVGYTAVTGRLDLGAGLLFLILTLWQMPHFYAIAIFRLSDYKAAHIPVLPAVAGLRTTQIHMLVFIAAYIPAALALAWFGYTGTVYAVVMGVLGLTWFGFGLRGLNVSSPENWARFMFRFSLLVLLGWSAMIVLDALTKAF